MNITDFLDKLSHLILGLAVMAAGATLAALHVVAGADVWPAIVAVGAGTAGVAVGARQAAQAAAATPPASTTLQSVPRVN